MSSSSDPSRRSPRRAWLVGTALLLTALVVGAAVLLAGRGGSDRDDAGPAGATPSASSPPVALDRLVVRRGPLCSQVSRASLRAALAARVARVASYVPGDRVELAPGLRDVANEFDCSYTAVTGARARLWVFAEPVTLARARRLARDLDPGCRALPETSSFGRAGSASVCPTSRPTGRSVTLRGLFGDAFLTCRVAGTAPQQAVVDRTRQWCATVVRSVADQPS